MRQQRNFRRACIFANKYLSSPLSNSIIAGCINVTFISIFAKMKNSYLIIFAVLIIGCSKEQPVQNETQAFLPGVKLAELTNKNLEEISGLEASITNAPFLWAHNDSGNDPEIFLLNDKLDIKLTCILTGVENRDWEDIAVGPGPDPNKNYIYAADIGDNDAIYQEKFIYRFEEPVWEEGKTDKITISSFDKITFQLEDERKDTEALLLHPKTKNLYVVSKREKPVYLYELKFPMQVGETLTAKKMIALPFTQIVAGDIAADGKEILLKNYNNIYYWNSPQDISITDALQLTPKDVPYEIEPQGESITWAVDGSGFYTLSEKNKKKKTFLYFYKRR